MDFLRSKTPLPAHCNVNIEGMDIEMVQTYKYQGVYLENNLDWLANTEVLHWKSQRWVHLVYKLRSFDVCRDLLYMFYE